MSMCVMVHRLHHSVITVSTGDDTVGQARTLPSAFPHLHHTNKQTNKNREGKVGFRVLKGAVLSESTELQELQQWKACRL